MSSITSTPTRKCRKIPTRPMSSVTTTVPREPLKTKSRFATQLPTPSEEPPKKKIYFRVKSPTPSDAPPKKQSRFRLKSPTPTTTPSEEVPQITTIVHRGRRQTFAADDPDKPFICTYCKARFKRLEHFRRHYHSIHTNNKPHACSVCGNTFSRKDNLVQHQRNVHQFD